MSKYKLAIIMRTDLEMGRGKQCVQAGHASILAWNVTNNKSHYAGYDKGYLSVAEEWLKEGQFKVVLKCPEKTSCQQNLCKELEHRIPQDYELIRIEEEARRLGLPVVEVRDFGKTQVAPDTLTCIAIGPALCEEVDKITGGLSLL